MFKCWHATTFNSITTALNIEPAVKEYNFDLTSTTQPIFTGPGMNWQKQIIQFRAVHMRCRTHCPEGPVNRDHCPISCEWSSHLVNRAYHLVSRFQLLVFNLKNKTMCLSLVTYVVCHWLGASLSSSSSTLEVVASSSPLSSSPLTLLSTASSSSVTPPLFLLLVLFFFSSSHLLVPLTDYVSLHQFKPDPN